MTRNTLSKLDWLRIGQRRPKIGDCALRGRDGVWSAILLLVGTLLLGTSALAEIRHPVEVGALTNPNKVHDLAAAALQGVSSQSKIAVVRDADQTRLRAEKVFKATQLKPPAPMPISTPGCDGVELAIGSGEQRCLKPGAGKATLFKDCADCPEMVVIPSGSFTMGSPQDEPERVSEREDHVRVSIAKPFAVGAFAVTRGEFAAFVSATNHQPDGGCYIWTGTEWTERSDRSWQSPGFAQDDRHPVTCVNWNDAEAYVSWLSSTTGKAYRLLSETEREYVTRAGTTTPFWLGSSISTEKANYNGNSTSALGMKGEWRQLTVSVDNFSANPWGLYNVHGNLWDWTEDCWNERNSGNPGDGSARATGDCSLRVVRGGSWNYSPTYLRGAYRYWNQTGNRNSGQGFRVARSL